jgi:Zn-dependent protease with chaperone function
MKWLCLTALSLCVAAGGAAQSPAGASAMPVTDATTAAHAVPADAAPTDAGNMVPVPVPDPSALASRHYRSGIWLWIVSTLWAFALPALIFFSGFSAQLRNLALRVNRRWYFALVMYLGLLAGVWFLADLPLDFYSEYLRPHAYGLSSQTFGKWLKDACLGLALGILGAALIAWIPLLLVRRFPRRWWLYAWLAAIPIMVFISFIEPIWVEPLFNQFGPMQDKALEARILQLAARAGIDGTDVYEVNKSVDTNELNAYVTGIGRTKRIVLWDTALKQLSPEQIEVVMAHEMGHYVLLHVWKGLAAGSVSLLVALWIAHLSIEWLLPRFSRASGVRELSDIAALPLLVLVLSTVAWLLSPPLLAVSRHFEHEADRFALELTHDSHACAMLFVTYVQHDLSYPNPAPLVQFLRASHPSIAERIEFCNSYHPWLQGDAGRYSSYIR